MNRQAVLFLTGAILSVGSSLVATFVQRWVKISENVMKWTILLIMVPFNPFLLLGKTLGLGYATGTGLYYLVLQSGWLIVLIALLGDMGWLLSGVAVGLHISAILLGWEFFFREEW